ncbi:MAG: hypothetical protein MN733_13325 [Nitrososphaera sp.]|nr:hypothetical protein [Nitrososphaera sp.]
MQTQFDKTDILRIEMSKGKWLVVMDEVNMYDKAERAIAAYVTQTLTQRQRTAIRVCNADMCFGPCYSKIGLSRWEIWTPILNEVINDLPSGLWYHSDFDEVTDCEPEGDEPFYESFYHFDARAIKQAVLGKELASCF